MKTIADYLRYALMLSFIAIGITTIAQSIPNVEKMSIPTQMFIDQLEGRANFEEVPSTKLKASNLKPNRETSKFDRPFSKPDTIDGIAYISSFIYINDDRGMSELEALGVQMRCSFGNGLYTALIPVDKLHEVAALDMVTRIEVATPMQPFTDKARIATNVDDVLNLSADAIEAGLDKKYDGTGVVLGIIDTGIDLQHIAFKDSNGNSRIKRAYVYNGSNAQEYTTITSTTPTTDDTTEDHGSHTSSAAGGSSVIINGSNVTVTDDHANATYGGMAPKADLYLGAINGLNSTYISEAFQKMVNYANSVNKPLVVSNSWGSHSGPHDGSSTWSTIVSQYFGDSNPNRICLFSAGNTAGNAPVWENGGCHLMGTASAANPLRTILRCDYYSNTDDGYLYNGDIAVAWCRSTNVSLGCKIYVLDATTGEILKTITPTSGRAVDVSTYYSGSLYYYSSTSSNKTQIILRASSLTTKSHTNGISKYTLALELYPTNGTAVIDIWGGNSGGYYSDFLTTPGYNWVAGTDDGSMGDNAVISGAISIGAYSTKNKTIDFNGETHNYTNFVIGDIAYFSSYGTPSQTPTGGLYPWIAAPGARTEAAVNHYHTGDNYSYIDGNYTTDRVNASTTNPYGAMQGTSMATPVAAGIVALWLQAAQEAGKNLYTSDVKEIMKATAIHDYWTENGPNASHFGNGKINALGGIQYILGRVEQINASPTELTFDGQPGNSYSQSVTVSGVNLTGDITATLNDASGTLSINTSNLGSGGQLVITYSPTTQGEQTATITLNSPGAEPVTITINASAAITATADICYGAYVASTLPHVGTYHDEDQHNQMIYPARKFQGTNMTGRRLKSMTFYPSIGSVVQNNYTRYYSGINFFNGSVTFKLANLPSGSQGFDQNSPAFVEVPLTTVKTVVMPDSPDKYATRWTINFDKNSDFVYNGGDLLIDVSNELGDWGYTFFRVDTIQDIRPGYITYTSSSTTTNYLPAVTFEWYDFIVSGTVSPTELQFNYVTIGKQYSQDVTITNNGTEPFTPIIDLTGLPAEFTVSGTGEILPNGTLDLTVTYSPSDEGPHSGSFTVTIGDQTYTVTVSGYAAADASTLTSNTVGVEAYHSDLKVAGDSYIFTLADVKGDGNMNLNYEEGNSDVQLLVKSDQPITRYDLRHKSGENGLWGLAGSIMHQGNSYVTDQRTMTFGDGETEMWFPMDDYNAVSGTETYYVPVTVAQGVVTPDNTYGAPIKSTISDNVNLRVMVGGSKSDQRYGGHWTNPTDSVEYCVYTTIVDIYSEDLDGISHKPYMYRAWVTTLGDHPIYNFDRNANGAIVGTNTLETPYLLGELELEEGEFGQHVVIGEEWNPNSGIVKMQNAFGAPSQGAQIAIIVRAYYQAGDNQAMLRAGGDGMYAFSEWGGDSPFDLPTGVMEIGGIKEVVDVTYVNTLGMQSSKPFDGLNIVVTRYSDGTTSTVKVMK